MRKSLTGAAIAALLLLPLGAFAQIAEGDLVTFEYTLEDEKGNQLDSSEGREPLTYRHGEGRLIPGLEKRLTGMKTGERKVIRIPPGLAYGRRDPRNVREIPKDSLPAKNVTPGDMFAYVGPQGRKSPITVLHVKEKTVIVDFNNPLAGKTLIFDIQIVDVKKSDHATTRPQTTRPDE